MSTTRAPAGAARPSERVDAAVRRAMMEELTEVGYSETSMEAVARRAGVGKAALYRRWSSKRDMYMTALHEAAEEPGDLPDTGSLHGDVLTYVRSVREEMTVRTSRFVPELIAIAARDDEFWAEINRCVYVPRRQAFRALFERAADRGELAADADIDVLVDLLVGGVFWRYTVKRTEPTDESIVAVAEALVRAAGTPPPQPVG